MGSSQGMRGLSMIEALIALAVMVFGMLALTGIQTTLRLQADTARQRTEATRIAQGELERLRSFASLEPDAQGSIGWDAIGTDLDVPTALTPTNARYSIERHVNTVAGTALKAISVTVTWPDRVGALQQVALADSLAGVSPALAGLLASAGSRTPLALHRGRHPAIPGRARELGGDTGQSVFKPDERGTTAWAFDNRTGIVTRVCTVRAGATTPSVTESELASCIGTRAQVLSGVIRFNLRSRPVAFVNDPTQTVVKPIPDGTVAWKLGGSPVRVTANCQVATGATVAQLAAAGLAGEACEVVDQAITPSGAGAGPDLDATDAEDPRWPALPLAVALDLTSIGHRFEGQPHAPVCYANAPTDSLAANQGRQYAVEYHCLVFPNESGAWSGSSSLVPRAFTDGGAAAWSIGTGDTDYRICRYTRARGAVAANADHPAAYVDVKGSLVEQNFLVITGPRSCPVDNPADPAAGDLVDTHTIQHQP